MEIDSTSHLNGSTNLGSFGLIVTITGNDSHIDPRVIIDLYENHREGHSSVNNVSGRLHSNPVPSC